MYPGGRTSGMGKTGPPGVHDNLVTAPSVDSGTAAWVSSGTLSETQNIRSHPRPLRHESSVEQILQEIHTLNI